MLTPDRFRLKHSGLASPLLYISQGESDRLLSALYCHNPTIKHLYGADIKVTTGTTVSAVLLNSCVKLSSHKLLTLEGILKSACHDREV